MNTPQSPQGEMVAAPAHIVTGSISDHSVRVLAILSALMALTSISTDLYLPAMPSMAAALKTSNGMIELTISGYLIGFSLGQLFWGPIGDRHGRRRPVAMGLVLFIIGSAGCAMAASAPAVIALRALQAFGACAAVVLARAMVRDLYEGPRAAQMMSTLMTVMAIAPLLGPLLGAQILHYASWRAIFALLVIVGLGILGALHFLPETLPAHRRNQQRLSQAISGYLDLLGNRRFLGYAGASGFFYGGIYAYIAGTPFAYITYHHVTPRSYGVLFGIGIAGIMVANMLNARYVVRCGSDSLMRYGAVLAAISGAVLAICSITDWGGLFGLVVPLFVFVSTSGFIVANSITSALGLVPERAGQISALIGAIQYGTGIAGSALVGALANGTPMPMGLVIAFFGVGSALSVWFAPSRRASRDTIHST